MRKTLRNIFTVIGLLLASEIKSQATVNYVPPSTAVQFIKDGNINVSNVNFIGNAEQIGLFDASNTVSGLDYGIILSTGDAKLMSNQAGNNSNNSTLGGANWGISDSDLELLTGNMFNDAVVLEFDFTTCGDSIKFEFSFASEEYNDYVCASNLDAFGIFLSGPGISGPFSNSAINIASLPDGSPIGINTINNGNAGLNGTQINCENSSVNWNQNTDLFVDNSLLTTDPNYIEYDGYTTNIQLNHLIQCSTVYHLKIVIGDGNDFSRDSALLLKAAGFGSTMELDIPDQQTICEGGSIELNPSSALTGDFQWSPSNSLDSALSPNPLASPSSSQWYYLSYTQEGSLYIDSTYINVTSPPTHQIFKAICDGESVQIGSSIYSDPGIYMDTLHTILGCDSIVISEITTGESYDEIIEETECVNFNPDSNQDEFSTSIVVQDLGQTVTGCDSTITTITTVSKAYNFLNNPVICLGESITVGNNVYLETGTYIDIFETSEGCDSVITTELNVLESFLVEFNYTICPGDEVEHNGNVFNSQGIHELSYTNSVGCDSVVRINITFHQTEWNQMIEICYGSSAQVGQNVYTEEGDYIDIFEGSYGCDSIVFTEINYLQPPLLPEDTAMCEGDNIVLDLAYLNTANVEWFNGSTNNSINVTQPGTYWVTALLDSCWATDSIHIDMHYNPEYNNEEKTLCLGEEFVLSLDPENGTVYWNNGVQNSSLAINESGVYIASIENACGNFSYEADIELVDCDCSIFIPNAFTPNSDGLNDYFKVTQTCDVFDFELFMFDRWGGIVYSSTNPDDVWDGSISEEYEETYEIFNYIITYHAYNEAGIPLHQQHLGTVHIMR